MNVADNKTLQSDVMLWIVGLENIGYNCYCYSYRKRSTATITFYKEYFVRLPGYPQIDSNGDLQLAIYSLVPGTGVLTSTTLKQVVEQITANISAVLGR